jgi:uncharacterized protein (DUF1499 family)
MRTKPDWQFVTAAEPEKWVKTNFVVRIMLILAILIVVVIAAAPISSLYLNIPGYLAFRVMLFAMLSGLVLAVVALVIFIVSVIKGISPAGTGSLTVMALGIMPPVIAIAIIGIDAIQRPLIHDISTDTQDPPEFQEVVKLRLAGENSPEYEGASLAGRQQQAYPEIQPIITRLDRNDALTEATQVVKDLQWEFINIDYDKGIIEAYDTSRIFGFVDDIIIRVRSEGRGSRVDIRSVSRVGRGDLGKNAERVKQFINTFRG